MVFRSVLTAWIVVVIVCAHVRVRAHVRGHARARGHPDAPLLGDRGDDRVRQDTQRRGWDREDGRRDTRGRPDHGVPAEIGIHDHADRTSVADRGDAADRETGQIVGLAGRRAPHVGCPADRGEARQIDPVVAGHETQERLQTAAARDDEDQRLDDLTEVGADRRGSLGGGVRRLVEGGDFERHALAGGGVEDAPDRGMDRGVGHGPESSIGPQALDGEAPDPPAVASGSIAAMVALILADGDAPTRSSLDAAWPGWDEAIDLVIAADGGARHAAALGVAIDLWVGDGDSIEAATLTALEAGGVPLERSRPDKDESDTELAIAAALRRGTAGIVIVGALGGPRIEHALANIGLLSMPELAGRSVTIIDARSRIGLVRAPGPRGEPVEHLLHGRVGDLVSLLAAGDGVMGVTTRGLAYPLVDEPLPAGRARGLSNVRSTLDAAVIVRRGSLLIVESPATL